MQKKDTQPNKLLTMKKFCFLGLLLLFFYQLTSAQSDDKYKETLIKLFRVSHTEQTYEVAIKQMFSVFKQQQSNVPTEIWNDLEKEMNKTSMDDLISMLIPVYSKHLTIEDLNELIKFYESPVGQKYAEKNPLIMQESMQVGQHWGQKIGMEFVNKLKEKGY
ncbi:DUF2059 domain-containing protein [Xiashengella succiniciproducens]|uniref:DUF2059 domain-containing protein n=1 Tax=Xiashengella succiniciproducens TaxID=2949635 RepID=A0A9J6ZSM4_9BACT|nr:DUF2059 domain-containing protein [Alkaliflexus sp. Ai-910]URW80940.1 DUF2059 domain-containing protein [Alkaliflexus sp. Ai-910]